MQFIETAGVSRRRSHPQRTNLSLAHQLSQVGIEPISTSEARAHERQILASAPAPTRFGRTLWLLTHEKTICLGILIGLQIAALGMILLSALWFFIGIGIVVIPPGSAMWLHGKKVLLKAHWHEVPITDVRQIDNKAVQAHLEMILARLGCGECLSIIERRLVQNWVTLDPTVWIVDTRTRERACVAIYDNDIGYLRLA